MAFTLATGPKTKLWQEILALSQKRASILVVAIHLNNLGIERLNAMEAGKWPMGLGVLTECSEI